MAVDLEKLKKLLAQDIPAVSIAAALGCSEGFISQQQHDDKFVADVAALRLARVEGATDRDATIDAIEDKILQKLNKSIEHTYKTTELLGAFKVLNGAIRRGQTPAGFNGQTVAQTVNVILPNVHAVAFIKNQNGEIIEAGGRSTATLPSNVLKQMAANKPVVQQIGVSNGSQQLPQRVREVETLEVMQAAAA